MYVTDLTYIELSTKEDKSVWFFIFLEKSKTMTEEDKARHRAIVEAGGEEREDFDAYLSDFQKSREDRNLPFRE